MPPTTRNDRGGSGRSAEARARAAARREQIRKAEQRRRMGVFAASGAGGLVVIAVVVFLVITTVTSNKNTSGANKPASTTVATAIAGIPATTYETVGTGTSGVAGTSGGSTSGLQTVSPAGTAITTDGKPTFVYVGGEFCPYCAGERWAIASALARFGTFTGLQTTKSAGDPEVFPDTATLSFVSTKFASQYLNFSPSEIEDRAEKPLQTPPAADEASFKKYSQQGGIPFLSINNQYTGSIQYDVGLLKGLSAEQIATDLKDPSSAVAKAVIGSANVLTAGICATTGQQPAAVCSTTAVKNAIPLLSGTVSTGSSTGGG